MSSKLQKLAAMSDQDLDQITQGVENVGIGEDASQTTDEWGELTTNENTAESGTSMETENKDNGPKIDYEVEQVLKIENWSRCIATQKVYSESFSCGGLNWRLMIFPRGLARRPGFVGVFLEAVEGPKLPPAGMHVEGSVALVNSTNDAQSVHKDFMAVLHPTCTDQGWDNLISQQMLVRTPGFVVDDTLTFHVKLVVPDPNRKFGGRGHREWDSRKETGYIGLVNQGATCYMSSLLQSMFHIPALRRAVFQMPIVEGAAKMRSIPWQMQRLFYELQTAPRAPETKALTKSFGWSDQDAFRQHDIQEFARVLQDKLEEKMKGSPVDGTMKNLFVGTSQTYIECLNVDYVSKRDEHFYDLSLNVKGMPTLLKSFENYIEVEMLTGSNQYRAEKFGLQDARKGSRFIKFPPVLQMQLKRFEYDPYQDQMVKINDRFEFPTELDLTPFLPDLPEVDHSKKPIYNLLSVLVHVGGIHGGHYYAFVRPSAEEGGQWYKIDDETVTKVDEAEAVLGNYGGPMVSQYGQMLNMQKHNSAYMLTYVRKDDIAELMRPVAEEELPPALVDGVKEEDKIREEEAEKKRKASMMTTVEVLLERDLLSGPPNVAELGNAGVGSPKVAPRKFAIEKYRTLKDLAEVIEKEVGIPKNRQAYFRVVRRENRCLRPNYAIPLDDINGRYFGPIDVVVHKETNIPMNAPTWMSTNCDYFYLHELPEPVDAAAADPFQVYCEQDLPSLTAKGGNKVLVSFKFFDTRSQKLQFLASRVIDREQTVEQLFPLLRQLAQGRVSDGAPLRLFEENKAPDQLPEYFAADNLKAKGVVSGDIFCFCEDFRENLAAFEEIRAKWLDELQKIVDERVEAGRVRKAAEVAAAKAKEAAALEAAANGDDKKEDASKKKDQKEEEPKNDVIVPLKPLFHPTPDQLLRSLAHVVRIKMEKRESNPVSFFNIDLYGDRSPYEAVQAVAEYLGEPIDHVRIFSMNQSRQYLVDRFLTYNDNQGQLYDHIQHMRMFVYETLDHSVDLLKTHIQASVYFCDDKSNLTVVRPMCPKEGDLNEVWNVVKEMLAKEKVIVPEGPVRALDTDSNVTIKAVIPMDTLGTKVWDWQNGYSNPRKFIRMEVVPVEERDVPVDQLLWCHTFTAGNYAQNNYWGVPFTVLPKAGETVAELRLRLAAKLGDTPEAAKRSWKLCQYANFRYEALPDDFVFTDNRLPPMLSASVHRNAQVPLPATHNLPALGIQRPDKVNRNRVVVDQGIRINEASE